MSKQGDYETVKKDILAVLKQPEYDDGSAGPVLVRLAWHARYVYTCFLIRCVVVLSIKATC